MELTIQLEDNADISFLKKMLSQIKGIKSVDISDDDKTHSWEEIEKTEEFKKLIEQSRNQIKSGQFVEHSEELMDSIFQRK
ncbi:hypothetical protein [Kaistella sp.]|uniref:hypothetical protein n=1 Tax=Kaistella sp. TaxID=2782235 RepID=UPI003C60EC8E